MPLGRKPTGHRRNAPYDLERRDEPFVRQVDAVMDRSAIGARIT